MISNFRWRNCFMNDVGYSAQDRHFDSLMSVICSFLYTNLIMMAVTNHTTPTTADG